MAHEQLQSCLGFAVVVLLVIVAACLVRLACGISGMADGALVVNSNPNVRFQSVTSDNTVGESSNQGASALYGTDSPLASSFAGDGQFESPVIINVGSLADAKGAVVGESAKLAVARLNSGSYTGSLAEQQRQRAHDMDVARRMGAVKDASGVWMVSGSSSMSNKFDKIANIEGMAGKGL